MEVCIAKYWSNLGESKLDVSIEFRGIESNGTRKIILCHFFIIIAIMLYIFLTDTMHHATGIHRIDLTSLTNDELAPLIQLKSAVMVLKPTESKITAMTARDVVPDGRQIYQNILSYNLHLSKSYEVSLHSPLLSDVLYESEFESQFWMLFDSNKMLLATGDAYSNIKFFKLDKGDYVVRLQVRHEKKDLLEKVSEGTMLATIKLANSLSPDVYATYKDAITTGKKLTNALIVENVSRPIFVAPLASDKISKGGIPNQCSWLDGTIVYAKDDHGKKVASYPFTYMLTEGPVNKKSNGNGNNKETKSKLDEYKEGLRDYQNTMIPKLGKRKYLFVLNM